MHFFFYILPILLFGPTTVTGQQNLPYTALQNKIMEDDNRIHEFVRDGIDALGKVDISIKSYQLDKLGYERLALLKPLVDEYEDLNVNLFLDVFKPTSFLSLDENETEKFISHEGQENLTHFQWLLAIEQLYGQNILFEFINKKAIYFDLSLHDLAHSMGLNIDEIQDLIEAEDFKNKFQMTLANGKYLRSDKIIYQNAVELGDPMLTVSAGSCGFNWYVGCPDLVGDQIKPYEVRDAINDILGQSACFGCLGGGAAAIPSGGISAILAAAACGKCAFYLDAKTRDLIAVIKKIVGDGTKWENCINDQFANACPSGGMCVGVSGVRKGVNPDGTPYSYPSVEQRCIDCPQMILSHSTDTYWNPIIQFETTLPYGDVYENGHVFAYADIVGGIGGVGVETTIENANGERILANKTSAQTGINGKTGLFSGFINGEWLNGTDDKDPFIEAGGRICVSIRGTSSFLTCGATLEKCFPVVCPQIEFKQEGNTVTISETAGTSDNIVLPWIPSSSTSNGEYTTNSNNPKSITYTFDKDNLPINKDDGKRCVYLGVQIRGKGCGNLNATFCFTDCDFLEPTVTCANYQEDNGVITIDDGYKFELYSDGEPQGSSNGNTMENIPGNSCFIIDIYHESANPAEDEPCRSMEVFVGGEDCTGICPPSCEEYNKSDIHDDSSIQKIVID